MNVESELREKLGPTQALLDLLANNLLPSWSSLLPLMFQVLSIDIFRLEQLEHLESFIVQATRKFCEQKDNLLAAFIAHTNPPDSSGDSFDPNRSWVRYTLL